MIEFRWFKEAGRKPVLQVKHLFEPVLIASGDIVLMPCAAPNWVTVLTTSPEQERAANEARAKVEWKKKYPNAEIFSL